MYLNCHTYYSLRYGTMSEEELLQDALRMGYERVAVTDINNTSACINFIRLAPKYGIHPIVGVDFRNGKEQMYVCVAQDNLGFEEINAHLSEYLHSGQSFDFRAPPMGHSYVVYPYRYGVCDRWQLRDYEYIGIRLADLPKLNFALKHLPKEKLVLLDTVTFRTPRDFNAHRLLRAIDKNTLLSKLDILEQAQPDEMMRSMDELLDMCKDAPFLLHNTSRLLDDCCIHFDFSAERKPQNQSTYTDHVDDDFMLLQQLSWEGLHYRYGEDMTDEIIARMEKELRLIREMDYVSYFLINWDICQYARGQGYFYVGRGSGANSIIAYLLCITDVDPIELDLYFERFINSFRTSPPDFDVDFSWLDRQDVTRYIFDRFKNVSLLATYNCFKYKGVVRELGKVFGLPKEEIDMLSNGKFVSSRLDRMQRLVLRYGSLIQDKPNHLSIHAGGILISERSMNYFSATFMPPKGFPTVQFDMVVAEDVGLYKFDILGQRGLAKIKETLEIISYNQPEHKGLDIHAIQSFKEDPKVNNLIKTSQCIGCFYVESPAMRMLLKKLKCDNYLGLVAASSIIRPGVAQSGMMREYILRHKDPKRVQERANPVLLEIMPDTYGVMVYQEDVIKVAHHFAGLTLGEADVLRRGMSGKYRSREEFLRVKERFRVNAIAKGHAPDVVAEVWRQIESFAGYAFAKGHSASYAVESYQTLFLKTYFPLEYMVAVLNNGGGFYRSELYIHEARKLGGQIHAPCVNHSDYHTVIHGKDIYLGMHYLHEFGIETARRIVQERDAHGLYKSFQDLANRVAISLDQALILIKIGAFRFYQIENRKLLWEAHFFLNKGKIKPVVQNILFKQPEQNFKMPQLTHSDVEASFDQWELLGFTLNDPFSLLLENPDSEMLVAHFSNYLSKTVSIYGYLVTVKKTKTNTGKAMYFGTFLDQAGEFIDTVHFPPVAKAYPFTGKGIYRLTGKVVAEFDFYTLEVSSMQKQAFVKDPRYSEMKKGEVSRIKKLPAQI